MKNVTVKLSAMAASVMLLVAACKRDTQRTELPYEKPELPATSFDYTSNLSGIFTGIEVTNDKATLGRVLFYDKHLSFNNAVSCGSCHKQEKAFADDKRFSEGFIGEIGARNTPPIFNLTSGANLFWDARANNLSDMVLMPIKHREEMGLEDIKVLENKLAEIPYYPELFKSAFGSKKITVDKISEALASFLISIRANNSPYDKAMRGTHTLNAEQQRGSTLYFTKLHCQECHKDANNTFSYMPEVFNIGLESKYKDEGRKGITHSSQDEGFFKAPQLRNLAFTAPYMHDGRFATLEEVVEHYNSEVVNHPNVSRQLSEVKPFGGWGNNNGGQVVRNKHGMPTLELTEDDKKDLIAFLKAMSDESMVKDPKFADPFKQ